jgi:hypothetical protein
LDLASSGRKKEESEINPTPTTKSPEKKEIVDLNAIL